MKTSGDFQAFYRSDLNKVVETLEVERKKLINRIYQAGGLVLGLLVISVVIGQFTDSSSAESPVNSYANQVGAEPQTSYDNGDSTSGSVMNIIMMSAIVGGLGYFFWFMPKSKELKDRFKFEVIGKMVKFVDPSLEYHPSSGISKAEFEKSKIFLTSGDRFMCEDLVIGTLEKTPIRFSEVHTQKRQRSNGDSGSESWVTLFKGMMFIADFNKHFQGRTVVLTDQAEKTFGSLGTMFQKMNSMRDPLIKFENVDFEKAFAVYGTNAIEAHYILSPALIDRIMSLKTLMGNIQLSFVDSYVFVSIPSRKNFFEARIFSKLANYQTLETYHRQLQLVTGIVENLNLNTRIWTKE